MGRSLLLLVSGFVIIFGIIQNGVQNHQEMLAERSPEYYYQEQSRNIAGAMLEIALGNVNEGNNYLPLSVMDHITQDSVKMLGGTGRITNLSSNTFNTRLNVTITGEIQKPDNTKAITTIDAVFDRKPFSIYAYFTHKEPEIYFVTGDVLNGPVHTNGQFHIQGDPVFNGPITSHNGVKKTNGSNPEYNDEVNFDSNEVPLPEDAPEVVKLAKKENGGIGQFDEEITVEFKKSASSSNNNGDDDEEDENEESGGYSLFDFLKFKNGNDFTICHKGNTKNVNIFALYGHRNHGDTPGPCGNNNGNDDSDSGGDGINKNNDGTVKITFKDGNSKTYKLSDFNGVISSTQDVKVKGTVDGQVTVHSEKDVKIIGDLVYENRKYEQNEDSEPISDDRLGIVSEGKTIVEKNAHRDDSYGDNNNKDIYIDASILSLGKSFTVENYDDGDSRGTLNILGGLIQRERGAVGLVSGSGYLKNYNYDTRFLKSSTPGFPRKKHFEIENWRESTTTVKNN